MVLSIQISFFNLAEFVIKITDLKFDFNDIFSIFDETKIIKQGITL